MSNGNAQDTQEAPGRKSFFNALTLLMEKHGMVDWVVAAKAVDGQVKSTWIAGVGDSILEDRERAGLLHFEVSQLALDILLKYRPQA